MAVYSISQQLTCVRCCPQQQLLVPGFSSASANSLEELSLAAAIATELVCCEPTQQRLRRACIKQANE
eukprot:8638-Heterococcus_DN1.PRE.2